MATWRAQTLKHAVYTEFKAQLVMTFQGELRQLQSLISVITVAQ